jgi:hypothetical protein
MRNDSLTTEENKTLLDEYSTNPDKEDARYIFDWDEFISVQKPDDSSNDESNKNLFYIAE